MGSLGLSSTSGEICWISSFFFARANSLCDDIRTYGNKINGLKNIA